MNDAIENNHLITPLPLSFRPEWAERSAAHGVEKSQRRQMFGMVQALVSHLLPHSHRVNRIFMILGWKRLLPNGAVGQDIIPNADLQSAAGPECANSGISGRICFLVI